jgi:hypothetical protein
MDLPAATPVVDPVMWAETVDQLPGIVERGNDGASITRRLDSPLAIEHVVVSAGCQGHGCGYGDRQPRSAETAEPRSRSPQARSRQALSGPVQGGSHTPQGRLWSTTSTSPSSACGPGTNGTHGPQAPHEFVGCHPVERCVYRLAITRPVLDSHRRGASPRLLGHVRMLSLRRGRERADTLACLSILSNWTSGGQIDETLDRSFENLHNAR